MKFRHLFNVAYLLFAGGVLLALSLGENSTVSAENGPIDAHPSSAVLALAPSTNLQGDDGSFDCTNDPENALIDELHSIEVAEDQSQAQAYDDFNRNYAQLWLEARCFGDWVRDKTIRDTGPYVQGQMYMVHPSVVIYYSPSVVQWLQDGRDPNNIPDNAIIIKEQYVFPAARYEGEIPTPDSVNKKDFWGWSVMFRNADASKDGWFWGGYEADGQKSIEHFPYSQYPYGGYGQINGCLRCHALAEEETYTFSALGNVEGEDGKPVHYMVDNSWQITPTPDPAIEPTIVPTPIPPRAANAEFVTFYNQLAPVSAENVKTFPNVIHDTVIAGPDGSPQFQTSNQCATCHGGLAGPPYGPVMYIPSDETHGALQGFAHAPGDAHTDLPESLGSEGINISPKGEATWSMMGLAGRDPLFYAQLESELNLHPTEGLTDLIQDTCLRCHGVMGQRQFHIDNPDSDKLFSKEEAFSHSKYGALARDGISCTVCHQIADQGTLQETDTGRFIIPPVEDGYIQINGPFENPTEHPMATSMGITPTHSTYMSESEVCASCHTIRLPVWDAEDRLLVTKDEQGTEVALQLFEQTTYLEWLNSSYAQGGEAEQRTCQSCHMPDNLNGEPLSSKIAVIQDQDYPFFEHEVPTEDMTVTVRDNYRRHSLHGLNLFALEMFNQFADILGVAKQDYMTGNTTDINFAIDDYTNMALRETAVVSVTNTTLTDETISAEVTVTNLVGHRFPSGVGFRRAFLQVRVIDDRNNVVWSSGDTNSLGVIVDADGNPLPTEMLPDNETYQPHHLVITNTNQVQIYEELTVDPQGEFTTSFISRCELLKDNRLMPKGWSDTAPDDFLVYSPNDTSFDITGAVTVTNDTIDNVKKLECAIETSHSVVVPHPKGDTVEEKAVEIDPDYAESSNSDTTLYQINFADLPGTPNDNWRIDATLYYQATPPYYLRDRFIAGRHDGGGSETVESERLYFLASNLRTENTPIEDWKLQIASHAQTVKDGGAGAESTASAPLAFAFDRARDAMTTPAWAGLAIIGSAAVIGISRQRQRKAG